MRNLCLLTYFSTFFSFAKKFLEKMERFIFTKFLFLIIFFQHFCWFFGAFMVTGVLEGVGNFSGGVIFLYGNFGTRTPKNHQVPGFFLE